MPREQTGTDLRGTPSNDCRWVRRPGSSEPNAIPCLPGNRFLGYVSSVPVRSQRVLEALSSSRVSRTWSRDVAAGGRRLAAGEDRDAERMTHGVAPLDAPVAA